MTEPRNAVYAQSGGVTAVINATACGVIQECRAHSNLIKRVLAASNGIVGILKEELFDTSLETDAEIENLRSTPGGAFGSCRFKLKAPSTSDPIARRIFDVFKAHDVRYFFYNGGGDSQDTTNKISTLSKQFDYPLHCIGIPKTVDNDLANTDTCPGFGSVAKYVAVSVREAGLDVRSMCETSTKVFILEVMGRHAGWIAASSGLAGKGEADPPHIILFPEIRFNEGTFLSKVDECVALNKHCVVVASEGVRNSEGTFLSDSGQRDSFGHMQLGGVAQKLAQTVTQKLGFKVHYAIADYLQRSARHVASQTDVDQAYAVGTTAVTAALEGKTDQMVTIERLQDEPYRWEVSTTPIQSVANVERKLPRSYITKDGFGITVSARRYLEPLIQGEAFPEYVSGLPQYAQLKNKLVARKLPDFDLDA
ncbi:MAG: 6-phosphofructokinase [Gammaproteobacteria bacterium]|nr:6-phosphofructokinase [Gammaproteobacteria bacterium]